jgi:hypothetical protein
LLWKNHWLFHGSLAFENFAKLGFGAGTTKKIILRVSSKDESTYGTGVIEFRVNFVVGNSLKIQNQCFRELGFHTKVYILLKYEHNGHAPHHYILIFCV